MSKLERRWTGVGREQQRKGQDRQREKKIESTDRRLPVCEGLLLLSCLLQVNPASALGAGKPRHGKEVAVRLFQSRAQNNPDKTGSRKIMQHVPFFLAPQARLLI